MTIFVTGCTHWDHERIIHLAGRPFESVEEMNEEMVRRWNAVVGDRDTVYHLGDIAWPNPMPWLRRLRGKKILIVGNHDDKGDLVRAMSDDRCQVTHYLEYCEIRHNHRRYVLFHYPIEDWNGRYRGSIHLHAHDHKRERDNTLMPVSERFPSDVVCNRIRVGVDAWSFAPVSIEEIEQMVVGGTSPECSP